MKHHILQVFRMARLVRAVDRLAVQAYPVDETRTVALNM